MLESAQILGVAFKKYVWSRMFLNMPDFLICLNKTKYGSISREYTWIYLKYNVKDTVKLL